MSEPEMKTAVVIQQQQTDKESKQIKMTHWAYQEIVSVNCQIYY